MNKRVFLAVIALVAVLVLIAGCQPGKVKIGMSEEEFLKKILDSSSTIKTYEFTMGMNIDMAITAQGQSQKISMISTGGGAIDLENKKAKIVQDISQDAGPLGRQTVKNEIYILDNEQYTYYDMMGGWTKAPASSDMWQEQNKIEDQIELLKGSEITFVGEETVNGVSCYVIEVKPSLDKLAEMLDKQGAASSLTGGSYKWKEIIKSFEIKEWIAKDNYYPQRVVQNITMLMNEKNMGDLGAAVGSFEVKMKMDLTMDVLNYNKPVEIVLPEEAKNAPEASDILEEDIGSIDYSEDYADYEEIAETA